MKIQDIRGLGIEELNGKIRQLKDERFRNRFKAQSSESRDTSVSKKLRRNIARFKTVLSEKQKAVGADKNV